jgi:hypothetical protein
MSTWVGLDESVQEWRRKAVVAKLEAIAASDARISLSGLSGIIQGAGGVGGLLFANFKGPSMNSANYCAYDGNGNVSDLVGQNGDLRAHYEYDPFGSTIFEEGSLAAVNPFRFSSKYWDWGCEVEPKGSLIPKKQIGR